ncbi:MAG: NADH-quinone oxidoreductase subunit A [Elusimicrobia bacterium]|nr:NADH-quinone oxidoreductase subunit A [Elusimicrobiota bacterium]
MADPIKPTTYECGMEAIGTTEVKTNVRFYPYALIFVIFEVETLYVYPWAVEVKRMGPFAVVEMFVFLGVLLLGLAYAWRKGALAWD